MKNSNLKMIFIQKVRNDNKSLFILNEIFLTLFDTQMTYLVKVM